MAKRNRRKNSMAFCLFRNWKKLILTKERLSIPKCMNLPLSSQRCGGWRYCETPFLRVLKQSECLHFYPLVGLERFIGQVLIIWNEVLRSADLSMSIVV